ncbi:conserved hypothetical protein [Brochothrix thermosphacta]|uniref:WYL domain-containing protein n=1 Tax=Brochothrix thermosphacta TaxID=2756 RepID=UPI000D10FB9C|nr:WYL domain-containing protein [Brochothrix thermosphacta]SOC31792.1 conserved hypothetical protein [Brochothrix thermosphacta]
MSRQFNELIKEFNSIRLYAREFYINGFKLREEFREKSLRSYDNERRRIESYLHQYIESEQNSNGKSIRLELKQQQPAANPFFKLWQTKSFTKNDIFLHFTLLDCLVNDNLLSLTQLTELLHDCYLSQFDEAPTFSEITVRNKLKEYCQLGVLQEVENEKRLSYKIAAPLHISANLIPVLHFFKEVMPGGVVGQFLLNQIDSDSESPFAFKHHFIVHTLDEQIALNCLEAISLHCSLKVMQYNGKETDITPLSLYVSTETGRQYLVGYLHKKLLTSIRLDNIKEVRMMDSIINYPKIKQRFALKKNTSWNGSFNRQPLKHLRVLLRVQEGTEDYLITRLAREQRMGTSKRLDSKTIVFEIELIDLYAINPFLRTFIGRIVSIETIDNTWKAHFINDMKELITLYHTPEEEGIHD